MQHVPLKMSQPTDLSSPLRAYLQQNFAADATQGMDPVLADIQHMRDEVHQGSQRPQLDIERLTHSYEEYLATLIGLGDRFMFGEGTPSSMFKKKVVTTVEVFWVWTDSIRPHKVTSSLKITFELSAVTFNIASLATYHAISCDRSTPAGSQMAGKAFLRAAGIFEHMAASMAVYMPQTEMVDLTAGSLSYLAALMLAQAATCSFETAVMKPMAPGVLAVLAMGVAECYQKAHDVLKGDPDLVRWINKSVFVNAEMLIYHIGCFAACANYWQSDKDLADHQYGVQVARLDRAGSTLESIISIEPNSDSVRSSRKKLQEAIKAKHRVAVKDNDTVYHYQVPKQEDLAQIVAKVIVKPTPYQLPTGKLPKMFDRLVPVEVQAAVQKFKGEMSEEAAQVSHMCEESTDVCKSALSEMNLPAALDALNGDSAIPPEIIQRLQDVQKRGGLRGLDKVQEEIKISAVKCAEMLDETTKMLAKEQSTEDTMRAQYQARWDRTPSRDITGTYHRDLKTGADYLAQAHDADAQVTASMAKSRDILLLVSKPLAEIAASLPKIEESVKTAESEAVRVVLRELSALLRARERLVDEFFKAVAAHDPGHNFMAKKDHIGLTEAARAEKDVFKKHHEKIDANLAEQSVLFDSLVMANQKFVASRKQSKAVEEKQRLLQQLNEGLALFEKLDQNVAEGANFYSDVTKSFLQPLKDTISGFVTARDHEARFLLDDLSKQFASVSISDYRPPHRSSGGPNDYRDNGNQGPSAPPMYH